MRSRYSAFVLERERYLLDTWSAEHRPEFVDFEPGIKWLGLDIKSKRILDAANVMSSDGAVCAILAEVEFVARWRLNGKATRMHENSRFERKHNRWFYMHAVEENQPNG